MNALESAVESFQKAAQLPEFWPQALQSLSEALGAQGAALVLRKGPRADGAVASSHSISEFVPQYMQMPFPDSRLDLPVTLADGFLPDYAHFSRRALAVDPYYQEFLIPRGYGCHAVASLLEGLEISLKRSVLKGPYDGAELALLDHTLPHLRSAARIARLSWQSHFSGQLSAFERLGRGAVLLDKGGRVLQVNGCVQFGDGLDTSQGHLRVARAADRPRLQRFLAAVLSAPGTRLRAESTTLLIARPSGRRPWIVDGIQCVDALRTLHSDAAALLLITNLDRAALSHPARLMQIFGLTVRESQLAALMSAGHPLKSIAVKLKITDQHARQRLKDIYRKTATSGRGELIALLSRL